MQRRKWILGTAIGLGSCLGGRGFAQQVGKPWRIGILASGFRPPSLTIGTLGGFQRGMRELGLVEGRDFVVEWRFGEGKVPQLDTLANELVQAKVDAIVAATPLGVAAAQRATRTIPIVMVAVADPLYFKFVSSLAKPGGNITGLSNISSDLSVKYLELLRTAVPGLSSAGILYDESAPLHKAVQARVAVAAKSAGIKLNAIDTRTEAQLEPAIRGLARDGTNALIIPASPFYSAYAGRIAELALTHRVATMFWTREHVVSGGLMSYGQDNAEHYRLAADYVNRIMKGTKPGDLPVQQPTKIELVVNRKTAAALGINISGELSLRADEVID